MIWIGRWAGESSSSVSGNASAGQRRVLVEPKQLLDAAARSSARPRCRSRSAPRSRSARGSGSAPRRRGVAPRPREEPRRAPPRDRRRSISSSRVFPMRNGASQPGSAASASSERSGHASPSARRRNMTRSRHCLTALVHGRRLNADGEHPARQSERRRFVLRDGERLLGEHERAEPSPAARAQGGGSAVECQFVRRLDRRAGDRFDVVKRKRRGEQDARRSCAAGDLADGEERLAGERIMRLQRRRPPVGHQEFAALARRRVEHARCDRDRPRRAGRRSGCAPPFSLAGEGGRAEGAAG